MRDLPADERDGLPADVRGLPDAVRDLPDAVRAKARPMRSERPRKCVPRIFS
jgi:hypothetical protein